MTDLPRIARQSRAIRAPRPVTMGQAPRRPRARKAVQPTAAFVPYVAPPEPVYALGEWPITKLKPGRQCRFACDEVRGQHRFCGAPTNALLPGNQHGSWCDVHLARVLAAPGKGAGESSRFDVDRDRRFANQADHLAPYRKRRGTAFGLERRSGRDEAREMMNAQPSEASSARIGWERLVKDVGVQS